MSKEELRQQRRGMRSAAGDVRRELAELGKVQSYREEPQSDILTITIGCTQLFTIICC